MMPRSSPYYISYTTCLTLHDHNYYYHIYKENANVRQNKQILSKIVKFQHTNSFNNFMQLTMSFDDNCYSTS